MTKIDTRVHTFKANALPLSHIPCQELDSGSCEHPPDRPEEFPTLRFKALLDQGDSELGVPLKVSRKQVVSTNREKVCLLIVTGRGSIVLGSHRGETQGVNPHL